MKIGVCGGPEIAGIAQNAGLEYFEWSVNAFLQPLNTLESFHRSLDQVRSASLPCPAVNVFIPGDLKITGPEVNDEALFNFVQTAMERSKMAEVEIIVFGSGGARRVPENFDRKIAYQQLIKFGRMAAQLAAVHGVRIAVEPLNRRECNILNSVAESAEYVREINHPNFRLLVDAYHWLLESESVQSILDAGDLLIHAHIATPTHRLPPGAEEHDFLPFFEALLSVGYEGRLSIEARLDESNKESQLANAVELIHQLL